MINQPAQFSFVTKEQMIAHALKSMHFSRTAKNYVNNICQ